jgi:hypothetical protein
MIQVEKDGIGKECSPQGERLNAYIKFLWKFEREESFRKTWK